MGDEGWEIRDGGREDREMGDEGWGARAGGRGSGNKETDYITERVVA